MYQLDRHCEDMVTTKDNINYEFIVFVEKLFRMKSNFSDMLKFSTANSVFIYKLRQIFSTTNNHNDDSKRYNIVNSLNMSCRLRITGKSDSTLARNTKFSELFIILHIFRKKFIFFIKIYMESSYGLVLMEKYDSHILSSSAFFVLFSPPKKPSNIIIANNREQI